MIALLAAVNGPFVLAGAQTGGSSEGPCVAAVAGVGAEHGPLRVLASVPYGVVVAPQGAADGFGQPELAAQLAAREGPLRPAAGLGLGVPLGGLADRHWRLTPWAGATLLAGGLETTARIAVSTAPGSRPVELGPLRTAPAASLAHGWDLPPSLPGRPPPPPPPDPLLDRRAPDELLAHLAVGPRRDDGGRVAGTLALSRGAATDLSLGLLAATPPRRVRLLGSVSAPIVAGTGGGLRLEATVELRPYADR